MFFSEDATAVTVRLDASSNATPFSAWAAQISVYIKSIGDTSWTLAGAMNYDAAPNNEEMIPLSLPLSPTLTQLVMNGEFNVKLQLSASQSDAVFWVDHLRFCDEFGGCNYSCPSLLPEETDDIDVEEHSFVSTMTNGDSALVEGATEISGTVHTTRSETFTATLEAVFTAVDQPEESIFIGPYTFSPQTDATYSIDANDLPFKIPGMITTMRLMVNETRTDNAGNIVNIPTVVDERLYRHNEDGTVNHFNHETLLERYDGYWYVSDAWLNGLWKRCNLMPYSSDTDETCPSLPAKDSTGNIVGHIFYRKTTSTPVKQDTDADTDTTIIIVE